MPKPILKIKGRQIKELEEFLRGSLKERNFLGRIKFFWKKFKTILKEFRFPTNLRKLRKIGGE